MEPKLARRESGPRPDTRVGANTPTRDTVGLGPAPELPRLVLLDPGPVSRPVRRHWLADRPRRAWFLLISICCFGLAFALLGVAVCLA
jgi:hypothetical protein